MQATPNAAQGASGGSGGRPTEAARAVVMTSSRAMGRTNGLDLSPDGRTLYVGESSSFELWAYGIEGDKLVAPRRLVKFDADLDGLRTDVDGKIYVARVESGTVDVVDPQSRTVIRRVALTAKNPTNLTFGGPDGKTVFVTQVRWRLRRILPRRTPRPRALPARRARDLSVAAAGRKRVSIGRLGPRMRS
jgi:YVTN family beta-propeller protein